MTNRSCLIRTAIVALALLGLIPGKADANIGSLACYGIADRWTNAANQLLLGFENSVNERVDQYVSLLNFDLGNTSFGVQGAADIGQLKTPPFSCSNPKAVLKSGMADIGLAPHYSIAARIFGLPIVIVDARLEGGQGPRTALNREPGAKDKVKVRVKVIGIDVLNKSRRGPETEVQRSTQTAAANALPGSEKVGAGGKLFDITRSLSDALGGTAPRMDVIAPFLYVTFDAGFFLQSELIFSYGVKSAIFNMQRSASFNQVKAALARNPANDTEDFCEAPEGVAGCATRPGMLARKSAEFYTLLKNSTTLDDQFLGLRRSIRNIKMDEMVRDARLTRDLLSADWTRLHNGTLSAAAKQVILDGHDFSKSLRPLKKASAQAQGLYGQVRGIESRLTQTAATVQSIVKFAENGFPDVEANGGIAFSGKAGAWARAMLVLDAVVARGWAGVEGQFTLLDVRAGVGASIKTRSQYVDLTATLEQVRMRGELNLFYGVEIGFTPVSTKYEGKKTIVSWPGTYSSRQWLAGRIDFRPAGKAPLFWCWDLFGSSAIDAQRCADGDLAQSVYDPYLANHAELKLEYAGEPTLSETDSCILTGVGGRILATSNASCASLLPANSAVPLTANSSGRHPIADAFKADVTHLASSLRDSQNRPAVTLGYINSSQTKGYATYFSEIAVRKPREGMGTAFNFAGTQPDSFRMSNPEAPMKDRIITLTGTRADVKRGTSPIEAGSSMDADLLIDMTWAQANWPDYAFRKLYVGDLPALPNDLLVEMAKTFRTGRCMVSPVGSDFRVDVAGKPYPAEGDTEGSALGNLAMPSSACYMGSSPDARFGDAKTAYAACSIREALLEGQCFPPSRIVALVQLANLTDADALRHFLATGAQKRITGDLAVRSRQRDLNTKWTAKVGDNKSPSDIPGLFNEFFGNTNYGSWPYDQDWKRCGMSYQGNSADADHWFERVYHSNCGLCQASHELFLHSHPSSVCYGVKSSLATTMVYPAGTDNCAQNAMKTAYDFHPNDGSKANSNNAILCNESSPQHRNNAAEIALPGLKADAGNAPQSGKGIELTQAIKRCIAGDVDPCTYTPENVLTPDDGGEYQNPQALASCSMSATTALPNGGMSSFAIPNSAQARTLDGCMADATNPSFSDMQALCTYPSVRANVQSYAATVIAQRPGANGNGAVVFNLELQRAVNPLETRPAGTCVANVVNYAVTTVVGQSLNPPTRGLAGMTSNGCALRARRDSSASLNFFVTVAATDDLVDPMANATNCWKALGFEDNAAADAQHANEVCSALPPSILQAMFAPQIATLTQGTNSDVRTGTAELFSQRNLNTDRVQACTVSLPVSRWKEVLNDAPCTLDLSPIQASTGVIAQTLTLARNSESSACRSQALTFTGAQGCAKLCALPTYLPFSVAGGAHVVAKFGQTPYGSPAPWDCNCAYDPDGDAPAGSDPNCSGQGFMQVTGNSRESQPLFTSPYRGATLTRQGACVAAWTDEFSGARYNGSPERFCGAILGAVQARLVSGNYVGAPTSSTGLYTWTGAQPPLMGNPTTVNVDLGALWAGSPTGTMANCAYHFARKDPQLVVSAATEWVLTPSASQALAWNKIDHDFGIIAAPSENLESTTFTLTNQSPTQAWCDPVKVVGANASDFLIVEDNCSARNDLAAGDQCTVRVSPSMVGAASSSAVLNRTCNVAGNSAQGNLNLHVQAVIPSSPLGVHPFLHEAIDAETDDSGNLYAISRKRNEIYKFSASGAFVKRVGSGKNVANGPTGLNHPQRIAATQPGEIYVTDTGNRRIVVYNQNLEFLRDWPRDGTNTNRDVAFQPSGIAVNRNSVFVTDLESHRIYEYSHSGALKSIVGHPGSGPGEFNQPRGIAVTSNDIVYVADTNNHRIQIFDLRLNPMGEWGSQGAASGEFSEPSDVSIGGLSGEVAVADLQNHRVQIFDEQGVFLEQAGTYGIHPGELNTPSGLGWDSNNRRILLADASHHLQAYDREAQIIALVHGGNANLGTYLWPLAGIAYDPSGNMYVSDPTAGAVRKLDAAGNLIYTIGGINSPGGIAIDVAGQSFYVVSRADHTVRRYKFSGTPVGSIGGYGTGNGQFVNPVAVAVDSTGSVFVLEQSRGRVQKFATNGAFLLAIEPAVPALAGSHAIAVRGTTELIVVDASRGKMHRFDPNSGGRLITQPLTRDEMDVTAAVTDANGNLYLADRGRGRITRYHSSGVAQSVIGEAGYTIGNFSNLSGIAIAPNGSIATSEDIAEGAGRIQKFTADGWPITSP